MKGVSVCQCGHVGDAPMPESPLHKVAQVTGKPVEHSGVQGHGMCTVPGCKCMQFTWKQFIYGRN